MFLIDSSSSNQEVEPICSHDRGLELCKTMRPPFWTAIDGLKQTECTWVSLRIAYLLNLMINQTDYLRYVLFSDRPTYLGFSQY